MKTFRPLNENELHCLNKLGEINGLHSSFWNGLRVCYEHIGREFTVCIIMYKGNNLILIWRGASRKSYHDRFNSTRGEILAFRRAIRKSRPVEIII